MNGFLNGFLRSAVLLFLVVNKVHSAGLPPQEALRRMKAADGFAVKLFANEPEIRQPLTMSFDERGRMWIIQYLQYPNPAGLKPVKRNLFDTITDQA